MRASSASALVIGGGIVGRACALALQRRGWSTTLADPDLPELAPSWGNAGHIAIEQVAPLASLSTLAGAFGRLHCFGGALDMRAPWRQLPWIARYLRACAPARFEAGKAALGRLLAESLPAWRRLARTIDAPGLLQEQGHWVCWESASGAARGRKAWMASDIGATQAFDMPSARLSGLRAALPATIAQAIEFHGTAQIADPARLAAQMSTAFEESGGKRLRTSIRLARDGRRAHAVGDDGERLDADRIVVCAGVRSRALMESLGLPAPLIAERGYHLQWERHDWPAFPPVVFEDRSMIVTRFASGLRAAGFVEYAPLDAPPDPSKWRRLARHVQELGLPVHGAPSRWHGARPTLPDYLPAIGMCDAFDNLGYAFGHQHLGLTLAAVSGELVADLCARTQTGVDCAPFDLRRFA